jgi:hypothetical protein
MEFETIFDVTVLIISTFVKFPSLCHYDDDELLLLSRCGIL